MDLRGSISERRRAAGLTQEGVASSLGVSRQTVGKWESGRAIPELGKLVALCDLLDCSLDELVGRTGLEQGFEPDDAVLAEHAADDNAAIDAAGVVSSDSPVAKSSSLHGSKMKYAAVFAAGVWLMAASAGLLSLLFGPSAVENVEARRIVSIAAALGVGIAVTLIVAAQLCRARGAQTGAEEAVALKRWRAVAIAALMAATAAACAFAALAPEARAATFVCLEVLALAVWPVAFAAFLAIGARR